MRNAGMFGLAVLILAIFIATNERGLNALVDWYDDSTHIAQRSGANFISGAGVTITSADDPTNSRVALTFSAGGQSSSTVGDLLTSTDGVRISFATTTAVGDMLTANDTRIAIATTTIAGTALDATDTQISFDSTEVATTTWGSGNGFTWTLDSGASDPAIIFTSDAVRVAAATTTFVGSVDISQGDLGTLTLGADSGSTSRSDATNKDSYLTNVHYTSAEENFLIARSRSLAAANQLLLGGGSSAYNAATLIQLITAGTNTTLEGSVRLSVNSAGDVDINNDLNVDGAITVGNGTEGAPGIGWTNDPDSGWWRDTANEINMSIAGSKWVEYKAAAMEFQQSTTLGPTADNDDLTISVSTNADITIDTSTNGDIYISPYDDLVMSSGLASGNMLILDGGTRSVLIQSGNVGVAPSLEIDHLDDTVFAGNSLGRLNFRTHDVASAVTGRIQLTAEADHNTGDIRTYMSFHPNDGVGGTLPEIFRISTTSVTVFGNSGTSDSRILFDVGGTDWHIGIDDSDADKLTIGAGTLVGSSRAIELFQDAQGDAHLAWGNNQSVDARFGWRLDGEITPGVGDNGFLHHYEGTIVEAGSGTHARLAQLSINAPTITAGGATVTDAVTVYIGAAPTAGTNNYALFVDAGNARFDGDVFVNTGAGVVVGNTAQVVAGGGTIETQMVGQSGESASQVIGRFSDDSGGPGLKFAKSRTSTIGGFELVQDNDAIGFVQFYASDNTDLATRLAGYSLR